ncbi:DNA-binding transcriptional response regulator, NtrC family, contains REC, AAA-type ATPase, and a Fis-type DNA-binding domains [Rubritalea squalenifaciens DSM 18772]|uniref:DNA-binding transcriptional response regulator, NtrC family, contains REC, AAA-type ATPase, and a Fis-type DNA-binding domains n=2 Tax=Rubritalea TaxID=361050 RepID=A0A1M6HYF3_9BACT|nr:sigma-54 dependent transcriptional regulator [Rubritalea squalenifaciens]SHJ27250.1 DNA-binding transcriptional response regulator, NtrC family, contains REC, AAA-type ATPase, and a Fis-type DNA-binding domains [Rubritalea squalenifaciens DSM 18772]
MEPTILIVDDEKSTRDGLRMALEDDFDCYVASDIREAMNILKSEKINLMLTDLRMGADSGMDLLDKALALPDPPIAIMMTAYGSVDTAVEAMHRGAWHFVTKPLNLDEVEMMIRRALRSRQLESKTKELEEENIQLRTQAGKTPHGLEKLIGSSPAMAQIHSMITQIAPTKATVLIEGESGTGKEVVARAIHSLSGRPQDKLVTVNCAALSPQLLESELFGHEKGSFTGASQRRIGRFEQANGGTIFLDEIGEIDQATQVKLLRVLSERTIERVGSNTPIKVDVRVITATNKNLRKMVSKGEFREDLFFRLNVVKIEMPPLRSRTEDIVLLTNAFLKEFSEENSKPNKPLTDKALQLLQHYQWPGNVRELRTAIEHGVVMSNDDQIKASHLPSIIQTGGLGNLTTDPSVYEPSGDLSNELKNTLADSPEFNLHALEKITIRKALQYTNDNRTAAAELLGISRRTLQRKLKEIEA